MSAYEKILLGWSNYQLVGAGQPASVKLGPAESNTKQAQQLVVLLPDKSVDYGHRRRPYAGSYFYHSGAGNDLDNNMTRPITLGAGPITLSFQARYQIETCWDYAYVEVSTDGGTTFDSIPTSRRRTTTRTARTSATASPARPARRRSATRSVRRVGAGHR